MIEYPKGLYRYPAQTAQRTEIEGLAFDFVVVADENAEVAALDEGWTLVPTIPVVELADEPAEKRRK